MNRKTFGLVVVVAALGGALSMGCATESFDYATLDTAGVQGEQTVLAVGGSGSGSGGSSSSMSEQACLEAYQQGNGAQLATQDFLGSCGRVWGMIFGKGGVSAVPASQAAALAACLEMEIEPGWTKAQQLAFCTESIWFDFAKAGLKAAGKKWTCGALMDFCLAQPIDSLKNSCMSAWHAAGCSGANDFAVPQ